VEQYISHHFIFLIFVSLIEPTTEPAL